MIDVVAVSSAEMSGVLSAVGWIVAAALLGGVATLAVASRRLEGGKRRLEDELALWKALSDADTAPRAMISREGVVLVANAAAKSVWGETSPLPFFDGRMPDDVENAASAYARLQRALSGAALGGAEQFELARLDERGGVEWWKLRVVPVRDRKGELLGACWAGEDVTAARVIGDVLAREREDLAEFLFLIPVGLYSANADGAIRFANQRLAQWLGVSAEELAGVSIDAFLADSAPEMEGVWEGRLTFRGRDGNTFEALVFQSTFDDAGATRTRSVVVRDDATRAAASEGDDRRFRHLFEGAPFGLCRLDLDGMALDCNPAFVRMAGESRERLIDVPLHDLLAADDRDDLDALLHSAALARPEDAALVHREVHFARNPEAAAALFVVPMGEGARDGLTAFFLDATAQRTLELQFAQAQKMQAMGQLAGGVAHDFNNLLTAMIGFCDLLLQRHGPGDPSFSDLMQVKQNANRAANLVRQLLAFSRKQPLRPRLLDVTDALGELSHLLQRVLGESVNLEMFHGRDLGLVRVDPSQFDQVVINLAVNARDAMRGAGRLRIRTRAETVKESFSRGAELVPPGRYALISVADTGIGIPRENLGRIFEPFFTTKTGEVGAGTGLGLSTVYGIIRQTGGFVFVDSTPGEGTEFLIYLPRQEAHETEAGTAKERASETVSETDAAGDLTGGGTLMIVEDEDPVRIFAARALRGKGYVVLEAVDGERALEVLAQHSELDLLITDMVMPGMDGATLARAVRRERPNLPVVLISGYSEEAARGDLADSVDFHFLPKPFSLSQLAAKVKALLQSRHG